jgi:uncharacterized repeat protein (TIGR03803 family)
MFYGTVEQGGAKGGGTVFRTDTSGTNFLVLQHFGQSTNDGFYPEGALIAGSDGALYGTTHSGGTNQWGTVFRLNTDGNGFQYLHHFGLDTNGALPMAGLLESTSGVLYGTTTYAGSNNCGTFFKLNKDGSGFKTLYQFSYPNIASQVALAEGGGGTLFGILAGSGSGAGTAFVFKIGKDGTGYQVLRGFTPGEWTTGMTPTTAGNLIGITFDDIDGFGKVFKLNTNAAFSVVTLFGLAGGDGSWPSSDLIELSDGSLCGTTENGGSNYLGTVFRVDKDGSNSRVLHAFAGTEGRPGSAGVLQASDGAVYGTTVGGTNQRGCVFTMHTDGSGFQLLHPFDLAGDDFPVGFGNMDEGPDGKLYGVVAGSTGGGVFRLNKNGSDYEVVFRFSGYGPSGSLTGHGSVLYGTTGTGGTNDLGTVFRLDRDGTGFEILHHFASWDGETPNAPLVEASDGKLYGTAKNGGTNNAGVVFTLEKDGGNFQVLHCFQAGFWQDGALPTAGLAEGRDGFLYGTTLRGGSPSWGTVFRLSKDGGSYSVLKSLAGQSTADGSELRGRLLQGSDGCFYAETHDGGAMGLGDIFRILPPIWIVSAQHTPTGLSLTISAPPGQACRIEAATDFQAAVWETLATSAADTNGWIQCLDPGSLNRSSRYYRARP